MLKGSNYCHSLQSKNGPAERKSFSLYEEGKGLEKRKEVYIWVIMEPFILLGIRGRTQKQTYINAYTHIYTPPLRHTHTTNT